jgi:membrane-bound serine protease (ClpP class)
MVGKSMETREVRQRQSGIIAGLILAAWTLASCLTCLPASAAKPVADGAKRIGFSIRIPLPIDGPAANRVRQFVRRAIEKAQAAGGRPVLLLEFDVPAGEGQLGGGSEFGAAYSLADFLSSEELNAATTVAYLPKPIQGHAVLDVIACDQIIMAENASLGQAGIDEKSINPPVLSAYREIAGRRRTVPVAIAIGLLDPAVQVLQVKTETGTEYVTPDGLEELKKRHTTEKPSTLKAAGEAWRLSAAEGRRIGCVSYLASNRRDLAKALELPPTAIEDDLSLTETRRAVRLNIRGPILAKNVDQIEKIIDDQIKLHDVNFICLEIHSGGGKAADAMRLANFLASLDRSKVRTVAYIPSEARSDAALVALACDQVVMHPQAVLGGPGAYELSADDIQLASQSIRNDLAPRKGRSWSLLAAMIDPKLDVYRVTKPGDVEYFCSEELDNQPDAAKWQKERLVSTPGVPLRLSGTTAEDYQLVNRTVNDFGQFKRSYSLERDPALIEPAWADTLIEALAHPGLAILLLIIGGAGIYAELHSPGTYIGAFVALVCFLLFFWSNFLGGTASWLEVTLFLAGIVCLLLEIFVIPGFGIFGLGGGILVLASLILASQTFVWPHNDYQVAQFERSLETVAGAMVGLIAVAVLLRRWMPKSALLNRMLLEPPRGEEAETIRRREALVDFHELLGQHGTTTTRLNPAGKARFADRLVDVMADGEAIDRGAAVEVVEVRGSRVLVREVAASG